MFAPFLNSFTIFRLTPFGLPVWSFVSVLSCILTLIKLLDFGTDQADFGMSYVLLVIRNVYRVVGSEASCSPCFAIWVRISFVCSMCGILALLCHMERRLCLFLLDLVCKYP